MAEKQRTGYFGDWGGSYVPETLMAPLEELTRSYDRLRGRRAFKRELDDLLANYVGRPTPLYHARRLTAICWAGRGSTSSARTSCTPARTRSTTLSDRRSWRARWGSGG